MKSKPLPAPYLVHGFLNTTANATVESLHPKAMPAVITTDEERDVCIRAPRYEATDTAAAVAQ
ncbi:hypothetical protein [Bradyrhizobium sp.]|uniref:hypothetical protein n=1 Tax=Bradyrhizobium sp. TaxID=376 RepID=UPI003C562580